MKRRMLAACVTLLMLLTLTACGGSAKSTSSYDLKAEESMEMVSTSSTSAAMEPGEAELGAVMDYGGDGAYESGGGTQNQGQKLIRTAWLELETTTFDEATQGLAQLTEQFGGYFETSSVANRRSGARWGDYTIRIPAEQYDAFLNRAGELCHETWRETSQEDISEAYYDTQGRLKTQQIKLERLQALLAQAEAMEDIITIESAISETEWNIESLSGTLRHYDGKVNYATVHVTLSEVYKLSNVEEVPDSFGQRLGNAFSDGLSDFGDTLENLAVSFAYSWLWWLLLVVVLVVVVRLARKRVRLHKLGRKAKAAQKTDDKQDET